MAQHQSYDNEKDKLAKLWNKSDVDVNDETNLKRISIQFNPLAFNKRLVTIPIDSNINFAIPVEQDPGGGGGNIIP